MISKIQDSTRGVESPLTVMNKAGLQSNSSGQQEVMWGIDRAQKREIPASISDEIPIETCPSSFIELQRSMDFNDGEITASNSVLDLEGIDTWPQDDAPCYPEMQPEDFHSGHGSFDIWMEIDVPGSPKLSRMFAALQILCPLDEDPLSLILPTDSSIRGDCAECFSNVELQALSSTALSHEESNGTATHSVKRQGIRAAPPRSHHLSQSSVKLLKRIDMLFASDDSRDLHISKNISPFGTSRSVSTTFQFSVSSLRAQVSHYNTVLKKLSLVCPEGSPGILATMTCLANTYHDLGNDRLAEKWYRQVINAKNTIQCANSPEDLSLRLHLINAIMEQGKYKEAQSMHQLVHCTIIGLLNPPHQLVAQSLATRSAILSNTGSLTDVEKLRREEVQFCLTMFGPEHLKSALALSKLGETMCILGHYSESEQLFRAAAQIQVSNTREFDARLSTILRQLLGVLMIIAQVSEWKPLGHTLVERSKAMWGDEHEETFRCSYQLAIGLRRGGFDQESTELLEATLKDQTKALGRIHPDTLCTMFELGWNLMVVHRIQEAIPLLEEELWGRLEAHGPTSQWTLWSCKMLGLRCYQSLERFEDALALWRLLIEKIATEEGRDHPAIREVEHWIEKYSYHWDDKLEAWCLDHKIRRIMNPGEKPRDFFEL